MMVLKNIGHRAALSIKANNYLIYGDFSEIRIGNILNPTFNIEPEGQYSNTLNTSFDNENRSDFYFCSKIKFYDAVFQSYKEQSYYYHYFEINGKEDFYICTDTEKMKIDTMIKEALTKTK
jgi:hypothetical protein